MFPFQVFSNTRRYLWETPLAHLRKLTKLTLHLSDDVSIEVVERHEDRCGMWAPYRDAAVQIKTCASISSCQLVLKKERNEKKLSSLLEISFRPMCPYLPFLLLYLRRPSKGIFKCAVSNSSFVRSLSSFGFMPRRRMGTISMRDPRFNTHAGKDHGQAQHGAVVEEIEGLIKVYKDGHVERFPIVANVTCGFTPEPDVASKDVVIDAFTGVWAWFYVPKRQAELPLLVYFHGGGFCVGSAAWKCYHEFLAALASRADCLVMSVNYRMAPENRLPAAFNDGVAILNWVGQQAFRRSEEQSWWWSCCNLSKVFIGGDSAGACLAHNVMVRLGSSCTAATPKPLSIKGMILIQPFFGGEARTASEWNMAQTPGSALNLKASDGYWRLALPVGASRDHHWCNPLSKGGTNLENMRFPPIMVCISEMDILKDRNLEFCAVMKKAGKEVEHLMYMGVGHGFQILQNYPMSKLRTHEMISHIKAFINR